jgi:hypothetical protein
MTNSIVTQQGALGRLLLDMFLESGTDLRRAATSQIQVEKKPVRNAGRFFGPSKSLALD